ncbi:MAG: Flp pilus assembly complex ATPase component TadA [Clostridia bacterium]|nr:Flp pilus assembly complex ATPase component TadA [Clostridia bacterium]
MDLIRCFPPLLREELCGLDLDAVSDIRLFAGRPCAVRLEEGEYLSEYIPDAGELEDLAQALTGRMLRLAPGTGEGYITLRGGHRMGLCGHVTPGPGGPVLQGVGSLCIRVAHEKPGCGRGLAACVRQGGGVLVAGAPGSGKTTMLRDAVRILSDAGTVVGLADERGEVAACLNGVPQLDVGMRTHAVDGCAKAMALRWLLRAMSPQLLAVDELYGDADCQAVREAAACGVPVLATAHAGSAAELCARPGIRALLLEGAIRRVMFLHDRRPVLTAEAGEVLEAACLGR